MITFGQWVEDIRQRHDLTYGQFARLCGLPPSHIWKIAKGEVEPTLFTAERIANALELKLSEVLKEIGS